MCWNPDKGSVDFCKAEIVFKAFLSEEIHIYLHGFVPCPPSICYLTVKFRLFPGRWAPVAVILHREVPEEAQPGEGSPGYLWRGVSCPNLLCRCAVQSVRETAS